MSFPHLPTKPWRDLRWWILILAFVLVLCLIFVGFGEAGVIAQIIDTAIKGLGAIGLKMVYDQWRHSGRQR